VELATETMKDVMGEYNVRARELDGIAVSQLCLLLAALWNVQRCRMVLERQTELYGRGGDCEGLISFCWVWLIGGR